VSQVGASVEQKAGASEYVKVLGLDVSRSRPMLIGRYHADSTTNVPDGIKVHPTQSPLASS